jgi:hypothetical protein
VTPEQRAELAALRSDWQGCYYIACTGVIWTAKPFAARDTVLISDTAAGLRGEIHRDYARRRPMSSSGP